MRTRSRWPGNLQNHVRVLGLLTIVVGALSGLVALFLIIFFSGAATLEGALSINAIVAEMWIVLALILMAPCIVTGIALLSFRAWSRTFGTVLCVLQLLNVPLGTILGIYGLWVLLSNEADLVFSPRFGEYMIGRR